jgi:hypothetical protein
MLAPVLNRIAPSATDMIRADHTRVLAVFHRYDIDASPAAKQALGEGVCLALEVHAELEEEIFYPAVRATGSTLVEKSLPEHEEIRRLIATLRETDPAIPEYDATFMDLMREVIHHVADEETAMLPHAETVLRGRLGSLGAQMAAHRVQLKALRAPQLARASARAATAAPGKALLIAGGAVLAGMLLFRKRRQG